ncbi:hypothetical protein T03_14080 [Trichinella britovi]|uniref:HTH psq-type domain-containing protein n=1 Tax=Trichinella britovi TaxID=45882 RepID=A0A0V1CD56_TRIBR|nr:hypothetical protein T03_14080 [Trichinella britovi]
MLMAEAFFPVNLIPVGFKILNVWTSGEVEPCSTIPSRSGFLPLKFSFGMSTLIIDEQGKTETVVRRRDSVRVELGYNDVSAIAIEISLFLVGLAMCLAKRKSLSVKETLAIIYTLNDGTKNSSVCEQFGSSQSTVSVILKNQSAILDARENGIASAKRFRLLKLSNLLQCLIILILRAPLDGWTSLRLGITFAVDDCVAKQGSSTKRRESNSQFDEISELDNYLYIDAAAITSDVLTMDDIVNDIHCNKQENSDDSDTHTATVESIPLKTYPELNDCVDYLERFIKATESADEGIVEAISVVIRFVEDHGSEPVRQPCKIFSPEVKRVDPQTLYHQQQLDELRRLAVADLRPLTEAYDELASNSSTSLDTATYFLTWD